MKKAAAIVTNRGGRTCHAAIVSRELGLPAVVGSEQATERLHDGQSVTVSCAEGETGVVYEGALAFEVEKINLKSLTRPKTRVMMNLGNPQEAFGLSFIPNDGVGLAREEFIISTWIKIHPLALVNYGRLDDPAVKAEIDRLTAGYDDKTHYFVDRLAQGVGMIAAAFYPKDVIVRLSDFKTNEYANLIGGRPYEPTEENPMLGFRGASRYYNPRYRDGFALECRAMKQVRDEMGLTNVKLMIPFCRTVEEGRLVQSEMEKNGLKRGQNGLELYVMCEIPSNVILADAFAELFDGFSIGSNDLTQLVLGVDRDSEIVAGLFDERSPAVKSMVATVIKAAKAKGRKIGICGQAPSDYPEFARFLVEQGIDSISLNPDAVMKTTVTIVETEKAIGRK
jgi:pyruvate,water dikinase